jgi:SAM-dependent methyltransferase
MSDTEHKKLAFDVEPSERLYRLRLARYQGMAEAVADWLDRQDGHAPPRPPDGPAGHGKPAPWDSDGRPLRFRLLDVGVGSGRSMRYLERLGIADRFAFIGLDNSTYRLTHIYEPAAGTEGPAARWTLVQADVTCNLPLRDARFDVVLCEQVLEHIDAPQSLLAEIHRVLRPGGLLVAGVPTFPPGIDAVRRHVVPLFDRITGRRRSHVNVFTRRSFQDLVGRSAGFDIIDVRGFRIISGGLLAPLEDLAWWYRLNRRLGRAAPSLCTEIQLIARKPDTRQ